MRIDAPGVDADPNRDATALHGIPGGRRLRGVGAAGRHGEESGNGQEHPEGARQGSAGAASRPAHPTACCRVNDLLPAFGGWSGTGLGTDVRPTRVSLDSALLT
ncbi:hypothetical protein ABE10_31570 [Bacillus toyonensis]|nr:hypothetical protein [Bacillus toyonensis]